MGTSQRDYKEVEFSLDELRRGDPQRLCGYCKRRWAPADKPLPAMTTVDWEQKLPAYEAYAAKLESVGL